MAHLSIMDCIENIMLFFQWYLEDDIQEDDIQEDCDNILKDDQEEEILIPWTELDSFII